MTNESIHRVIEQHAATRGDVIAIAEPDRARTYRELNHRANVVARHLMACGFRRGRHACVRMPRGIELATILLGILKAGGSYTWSDPERTESFDPPGLSICTGIDRGETRYLHVDMTSALVEPVPCCPNLPILTRATDVACVLLESGAASVIVPHSTITALRSRAVTHPTRWTGEPGAFDLWMALMAGTTAVVGQTADIAAA